MKGSVVRAHIACLTKANKLTPLLPKLERATAEAMTKPPLSGTWVHAGILANLAAVVHHSGGDEAVLEMSNAVIKEQSVQSLIPMVQGVLRIFGTSPASIFSRFPELIRTSVRGLDFEYQVVNDHSGVMQVKHQTDLPLHRASFLTSMPALDLVFRLCGAKGRVSMPEIFSPSQARYRVDW